MTSTVSPSGANITQAGSGPVPYSASSTSTTRRPSSSAAPAAHDSAPGGSVASADSGSASAAPPTEERYRVSAGCSGDPSSVWVVLRRAAKRVRESRGSEDEG